MNEVVIIALVVLAAGLASLTGLGLMRRLVPTQRLAEHPEVTGALYVTLGAMYSVLLAFVVIAAWDDYRDAHAAVANETTTVRNLARITSGWPAADWAQVAAALVAYAHRVV
jgi:predicted membrane chloride channel (bestrophin family)